MNEWICIDLHCLFAFLKWLVCPIVCLFVYSLFLLIEHLSLARRWKLRVPRQHGMVSKNKKTNKVNNYKTVKLLSWHGRSESCLAELQWPSAATRCHCRRTLKTSTVCTVRAIKPSEFYTMPAFPQCCGCWSWNERVRWRGSRVVVI